MIPVAWRSAVGAGMLATLAGCSPDHASAPDATSPVDAGACPSNPPATIGQSGGPCSDPGLICRYGCAFSPYQDCTCSNGTWFCPVPSGVGGCQWAQSQVSPGEGDDCSYGCDAGSLGGDDCTFACPGEAGDRFSASCQASQQPGPPRWHVGACPGLDAGTGGDAAGTDAGSE